MSICLRRRDFITFFGGAAAWPLAVRAQQRSMPVVGVLTPGAATGGSGGDRETGLRRGLAETGYVEGRNVAFEYRFADGQMDRLPQMAADLVNRKVAVIATNSTFGVQAAKAATTTIPIVFLTGGDAVDLGLVASYNRPGGNLTGTTVYTNELWTKRVELMRELVPSVSVIGMLVNPNNVLTDRAVREAQNAARLLGVQLLILDGSTENEIDAAFASLFRQGAGALIVQDEAAIGNRRDQVLVLAGHYRIPAGYPFPEYARAGGLMSYGPSLTDAWRQVGNYVGRILKGDKPSDLPVVLPTKFELFLNLRRAKALGLPAKLLAIADEVIE
jgi:putative ABC transport system substrate-binding protein